MANFKLPYYKGHIDFELPDELVAGVLVSQTENYVPTNTEQGLVREALESYKQRMAIEEQKQYAEQSESRQEEINLQDNGILQEGRAYLEEIRNVQKHIYESEFSQKLQRLQMVRLTL